MDTGMGEMTQLSKTVADALEKKGIEIFKVDEILDIKGSKFRIHQITKDFVVLAILPK